MQGHTKDIKAIKQQLDQLDRTGLAPTIRIKPPEIEIDRALGDKSKSPSGRGGRGFNSGGGFAGQHANGTQRRRSFESSRGGGAPHRQSAPWLTAEQQYQQQHPQQSSPSPRAQYNAGLHNNNPHQPSSSPRPFNPHSGRQAASSSSPLIPKAPPPSRSHHVQPHRPFSPQPQQRSPVQELLLDSPFSPPQSPFEADGLKPPSGVRRPAEIELHYRDPKGKEHGPFKLQEVRPRRPRCVRETSKEISVWSFTRPSSECGSTYEIPPYGCGCVPSRLLAHPPTSPPFWFNFARWVMSDDNERCLDAGRIAHTQTTACVKTSQGSVGRVTKPSSAETFASAQKENP